MSIDKNGYRQRVPERGSSNEIFSNGSSFIGRGTYIDR